MTNTLTISITETDLLEDLVRYGDESEQQRIAVVALRIGMQALRHARGEVDAQSLQRTAEQVFAQLEQQFTTHNASLLQQFSRDQPDSALNHIIASQEKHYTDIRTALQEMTTRKQVDRSTTQGGTTFEDAVGVVLGSIANGAGDHCDPTGNIISKSKVGDFVVTLGNDCVAAGERIVVEAKRDKKYTLEKALSECRVARENRDAQVALFVWDREYGQAKHQPPLARYGKDILVLWDEQDATTDAYVDAAYWLARSMLLPQPGNDRIARVQEKLIASTLEQIVALGNTLDQIKKAGEQVVIQGTTVVTQSLAVQAQLAAQVETLRDLVSEQTSPITEETNGNLEEQPHV